MVNWNGADVMIPQFHLLEEQSLNHLCIISNTCCFEMTKLRELRTKGKIDIIDAKH
jgi:hypothetical protein